MIDNNDILNELGTAAALWCGADCDATELAAMSELAVSHGITDISVAASAVGTVWPWLERSGVRISARFYVSGAMSDMSAIATDINAAFKNGARAVQVFMRWVDVGTFVKNMHPVRDDLFFNRDLSIGLDIFGIEPDAWFSLRDALREIGATSVLFALPRDAGDKSDFVGRLYGVLDTIGADMPCPVHFRFPENFMMRCEQTTRLVAKMCPNLSQGLRFFIG